ncbi:MAG TPA: hypothetical protein VGD98_21460 [Ktedonobacteraceae bacterium]
MEKCEFCGAFLPADAGFCGICGRVPDRMAHQPTRPGMRSEFSGTEGQTPFANLPPSGYETSFFEEEGAPPQFWEKAPTHLSAAMNPASANGHSQEEEEERRRRAALLGLGMPLAGGLAELPAQSPFTLPGTPQMGQMPVMQGVPALQAPMPGPPTPFVPAGSYQGPGGFGHGVHPGHPGHPGHSGHPTSTGSPAGCLSISLIIGIVLLVILGSIVTLGLTTFKPIISLTGNASVVSGGTLTLQGSSFLPNSNVKLSLDNTSTPLYYLQRAAPDLLAARSTRNLASASQLARFLAQDKQAVTVQGDGSFSVSLQVDPAWQPGQHTIHASETLTHRSASLNFTIIQAGATVTPTPTPTVTPAVTPTTTPATTPTATSSSPSLSCATPNTLALGPLSEKSSQATTNAITLCSSGSGQLSWQASWAASWLQLNQTHGSLLAPNQLQITATASAAKLAAGNYQTTITFSSPQSNSSQTVQVSLTVQAGCVNAAPASMHFSGVANTSDPAAPQTLVVTNCGLASTWSASIVTANNWLTISPATGTLAGGASGNVTVTASNLQAGLKAGDYSATIAIAIGSQTRNIAISLTVQAAPTISASPKSINGASCATDPTGGYYSCAITLTNNSSAASLTWSATFSIAGVSVQASSQTIAAGGTERVTLLVSKRDRNDRITITFTGPANAAQVNWYYQIIIT